MHNPEFFVYTGNVMFIIYYYGKSGIRRRYYFIP